MLEVQEPFENLSEAARFTHMSLRKWPHLTTPDAIVEGARIQHSYTAPEIDLALRELEAGERAVVSLAGWARVGE